MNKFLLMFLALFIMAGTPLVHAADDTGKPKPEEEEPECD